MTRLKTSIAIAIAMLACVYASATPAQDNHTSAEAACSQRATVIGVRGSGDPQSGDVVTDKYGDTVHGMGKPGAAFALALANRLPRGAVTFDPVVYPAVGLLGNWRKIVNAVGAGAKIGFLGSYTGSVKDGKAALQQVLTTEARVCPKVKLVLVGYSQGAQVVADVYQRDLSPSQRSRIAGVVLFGDPYFNPADTKPDVGSFDPTRYGALGKRGLYPSSSTPIFSICHLYDPICQGPGRDEFEQHTNYQSDSWVSTAAAKIAANVGAQDEAGASTSLPTIFIYKTPERRPAVIAISADGSLALGGIGGNGRPPNRRFGHLQWTTWTQTSATATGAEWADDCNPDCATGTFSPYPVTVRAFAPVDGRFTRMTVRGKNVISDDSYKHTEINLTLTPLHPGYIWNITP